MLEAWYLPGLEESPDEWLEGRSRAGAAFRAPTLSVERARAVAGAVRDAAMEARTTRSTEEVIATIARAAGKLSADGPEGVAARELLRSELGWNERLIRETLEGMSRTWTREALTDLVVAELGGTGSLDGFVVDPLWRGPGQRRRRALGSPVVLQVLAVGALFLLPSFYLLYRTFKGDPQQVG